MPVSFKYMKPGTTVPVPLDDIDRLMCEMDGSEYSKDDFCLTFQVMEWVITAICWHGGPSNKEITEKYIENYHNQPGVKPDGIMTKIIRRFCYEEYVVDAWR